MTRPPAQVLEGGCACGELRYRLRKPPLIVHACHCRNCQRLSGAWHAVNALIEAREVDTLRGRLHHTELPTPSGQGQSVARCSNCSVAVWSNYHAFCSGRGDAVRFVRVGTLDEPGLLPPDVHIYTASRNTCAPQLTEARSYAAFYDLREVWSSASLARLRTLRGAQAA